MKENDVAEVASSVDQWSPTIWAPGTSFVEDNFSTERSGVRGGAGGGGSGSNASDGGRPMKLRSFARPHLLLGCPLPNRPRTCTSLRPRELGIPGIDYSVSHCGASFRQ